MQLAGHPILPTPGIAAHGRNVVLRPPAQQLLGPARIGPAGGHIASAARHDLVGHGAGHEGMLTEEQLDELAAASGPEFDALWLSSMIAHHEGAITMAQEAVDDGQDADVRDLAEQIVQVQQDEIAQMRALSAS